MLTCIKPGCSNQYDGDPDDYCPSCREANKAIAANIDAQMATKTRKEVKSTIQLLEEQGEVPVGKGLKLFSRKINYGNSN